MWSEASAFTITAKYEHVRIYEMLVSYTVCCCPEVSICSVPGLPAVALAIEAKYGLNESGRSAQGTVFIGIACMITLMMSKLLAANLEEADPAVYEILQRVRHSPNDDRFPQ